MATHRDVMLVVLNHIDEVPDEPPRGHARATYAGCSTLDGLDGVPVLATSATHRRGHRRAQARDRQAGRRQGRHPHPAGRRRQRRRGARWRRRTATPTPASSAPRTSASSSTRWPTPPACPSSSTPCAAPPRSVRAGPPAGRSPPGSPGCARTRCGGCTSTAGRSGKDLVAAARSSMPQADQVQQARVETTVRDLCDDVSRGLARAVGAGRAARLHLAVRRPRRPARPGRDHHRPRRAPGRRSGASWCGCCSGCCCSSALGGAVWLGALAGMAYLQLPVPETPDYRGFPLPDADARARRRARRSLLALLSRVLISIGARSRARRADRRLRAAVVRGRRAAGDRAGRRPSSTAYRRDLGGPARRRRLTASRPQTPCATAPSTAGRRAGRVAGAAAGGLPPRRLEEADR